MAFPRLAELVKPSQAERLVAAQEAQAAALTRLVELAELYLQVDPLSVAQAADAAAHPGTLEVDDPKPAELLHIEAVAAQMIQTLGRVPTDAELEEELQRLEAVDRAAQAYADGFGRPPLGAV